MSHIRAAFLSVALLGGCDSPARSASASSHATQATAAPATPVTTPVTTTPVAMNVPAQQGAALDPSRGQEIGQVFEAYLSPHQEAGE